MAEDQGQRLQPPELVELAWLDTCSAKDHATTAGAASVGAELVGWAGWSGSMVGSSAAAAAELHAEGHGCRAAHRGRFYPDTRQCLGDGLRAAGW